MASAPRAARGFSPLDDELALAPCGLAPGLHEGLVRLATWIPSFAHAARELSYFTGATVPETTARRLTQDAGAAYSQVQHAQVERIRAVLPAPPPGPPVQQLSVDGALVPLVGGEWAEVKTLVVGALAGREPGACVRAEELSYFSQLADAAHFTAAALVETHRRGTETADAVVAVMDGAAWEQGFVDAHRADAVRVLDFCHAAGYLTAAAQAVYGPGTSACGAWVERQRHELRYGEPEAVLTALRALHQRASGEAQAVVRTSVEYLHRRSEQIRYAEWELLGLPLGSGAVESANKLLVEERLKGGGMHWARQNVSPMLALRTIAFNDRWEEAWPQIGARLRAQRAEAGRARRAARRGAAEAGPQRPPPTAAGPAPGAAAPPALAPGARGVQLPNRPPHPKGTAKPAPDHPWRRRRFGRACQPQAANAA